MTDKIETAFIQMLGRRTVLMGAAASTAFIGAVRANASQLDVSQPAPEGLPKPNQGSILAGKVAVITGAARGIGRAIAWEMAANGADIVAVDICGPVSSASNAVPATSTELDETADGVRKLGRKCKTVHADIRDIAALRTIAADTEQEFGRVDILVANAAIQRWKPLLEMEDTDWHDVIENNLNGTANTVRAFAPGMVKRQYGRIIYAGQAGHRRCELLFGVEVGHPWTYEVGVDGAGQTQDYCQRVDPWPCRYGVNAIYRALPRVHGHDGDKPAEGSDPATGVGRQVADGAAESWLDEAR